MVPTTENVYTRLQQTPEVNPDETDLPMVAERKAPLQPNQLSYREISTVRTAIRLFSIIIANCVCSGFICLCLGGFSKIDNLSKGQKRAFNTVSLLLSTALGFGIGFLFDRIGLLARGTILRSKPHTAGVCTNISVVSYGLL